MTGRSAEEATEKEASGGYEEDTGQQEATPPPLTNELQHHVPPPSETVCMAPHLKYRRRRLVAHGWATLTAIRNRVYWEKP